MNKRLALVGALLPVAICALAANVFRAADETPEELATRILDATGVKGGLIVHVGCGDGKLTAALCANDSYVVQGLAPRARDVEEAREHIKSQGLYGKVTVDQLRGRRLPYVDNLVTLVVSERLGKVAVREVLRVLAPEGVAYLKRGDVWQKITKPRPDEIDEWTHYLHDPSNNAVSHDQVVGPPRHVQWVGSPRWSRHHDRMASMSALVSTGDRIFYIFDEGPTGSVQLPPEWQLIARDAFNGTVLWKRPIDSWHPHLYPFKSGPAYLPRRLVAIGDTVYVTLGLDAPLSALDAATGEMIRTYEDTKATEDIIASDGVLFLVVNGTPVDWSGFKPLSNNVGEEKTRVAKEWPWDEEARHLRAIRADTGELIWSKDYPVAPLTLAADSTRVAFHDGESVVCLDRQTGEQRWRSEPVSRRSPIPTNFGPNVVLYEDVVLFSGGNRQQCGLSADTGEILWSAEHPPSGHNSPEDLLVVNGLAWSGAIAGGKHSGVFTGRDIHTGEAKVEFPPDVETYWFHHRCYRSKATDRYILSSRTGIEFVDPQTQHWECHHWVRGGCIYGIMPCNGLIYAPMHDCACYPETKLYGFNVLASESPTRQTPSEVPEKERLERGPAYGKPGTRSPEPETTLDWPTYRHDALRSGTTEASVPAELDGSWEADLGGRLSSPVVAGGKVYVASVDTHTVHALDADSGDEVWSYTVGGRVDSPPTVREGRVLFGSADGWVYCLRAADGELAWRYRAAPEDRRVMAWEQVESVWPVHGSVLVQDDAVYCVAGRSMFLDGGLRLLRLDPGTGRKLGETVLDDRDPETGENLQSRVDILNMPVGLPDVLSGDGRRVYMKSQVFDPDGTRQDLGPHSGDPAEQGAVQAGETAHLFAPMGFLDGTWFHRSYWVYGRSFAGGHAGYHQAGRFTPSGRILAVGDESVYGYGRLPQYLKWTTPIEYHLFAASKDIPVADEVARRRGGSRISIAKSESLNPAGKPLTVEAWVKAGKADGVIVARGGSAHGYVLLLRGGKARFTIRVSDQMSSVAAGENVVGKWVHLAGVLTPDQELQIYVNGTLARTADARGLIAADPAQPMEIGVDDGGAVGNYSSPFGFNGAIDEVRVYHRALTPEEIGSHCTSPGPSSQPETELVLYYSLDEGKATDESGKSNDGTAEGAQAIEGKSGQALKFTNVQGGQSVVTYDWSQQIPFYVRGMVLSGGTLFIAGPPDVVDEDEVLTRHDDPAVQALLAEQSAALEGSKGALLWAVSASDGAKLAEYNLDSLPVWDGMAATSGRLYLSTVDGKVVCMAGAALTKETIRSFMASMEDERVEEAMDSIVEELGAEDDPETMRQALAQAASDPDLDQAVKAHGFSSGEEWVETAKKVLPGLGMAMTIVIAEMIGIQEGSKEYKEMMEDGDPDFARLAEVLGAPGEQEVQMIVDVLKEQMEEDVGTPQ